MERLETIKEQLVSCIEAQLSDLCNVDTHELGEAIDMIKDLDQAIYYQSVVEAMEASGESSYKEASGESSARYYTMPYYPIDDEEYWYYPKRDIDKKRGRMYYGGETRIRSNDGEREIRDAREGRSGARRRMYMEAKELHKDKDYQLKELEEYLQELSEDVTGMIEDASTEELQLLEKKLANLTNKIAQLNVKH